MNEQNESGIWLPPAGTIRTGLLSMEKPKTTEEIEREALIADLTEKMEKATPLERFVIQGIVDGTLKDTDVSDFCRKYISSSDAIFMLRSAGYTVAKHRSTEKFTNKSYKRTKK